LDTVVHSCSSPLRNWYSNVFQMAVRGRKLMFALKVTLPHNVV
jgi:hypothetical protein